MIDIGVVYYRIKESGNGIDAICYTSRQDKKEIGTDIAKGDTKAEKIKLKRPGGPTIMRSLILRSVRL